MGWRDDPVVQAESSGGWQNDPVVEQPKSAVQSLLDYVKPAAAQALTRVGGQMLGPIPGAIAAMLSPRQAEKVGNAVGETAAQTGSSMVATPVSGLAGIAGTALPGPPGQGADWQRGVQEAMTYQPRTAEGQAASNAANYSGELLDKGATALGGYAADKGMPGFGTALKTGAMALPLLMGGKEAGGIAREGAMARDASLPARGAAVIPSIEKLKAAKNIAYKVAENSGITVSKESFGKLVEDIRQTLAEKGADKTLTPDTIAAFKRFEETANDPSTAGVSLKGIDILRQVVNDARGGLPRDAHKAGAMLDKVDDYLEKLGPSDLLGGGGDLRGVRYLEAARELNTRYSKAEQIQDLMNNASIKAGGYSNAGYENALRIEFKNLAVNKNRMRRFTKDEQAAIRRAGSVDAKDFATRLLGKLAIRGPISAILVSSFGPLAGPAIAGAGEVGAYASRALRSKKANAVSELVRRGTGAPIQTAPGTSLSPLGQP